MAAIQTHSGSKPKSASSAHRSASEIVQPGNTGAEPKQVLQERADVQGESYQTGSRESRIRDSAYRKFEARGGAAGHEVEDWLDSEREIGADEETGDGPGPRA
ncbi:MAG: DUF2934 domain-containing protein [Burkholderiaceae bacterium]